ncbi:MULTISPECIES: MauE/DoxX family redox-associated membrane protein [Corynebacterium]|uniref:DoxX family membrane protein n=1 Tax=Corynebacterium flavescens TaxID=28028 RepID=A0A1L7CNW4_CORFL|nr:MULTISPECIES: MauE/DoxX family redox-associated membrane protein [Corynebacterium]APT87533.1 DoxX family membrane protein [Corynebacterium flavescens]KAA8720345.1 DoxX family membrane protein [Corynebacterium flavescens]MDN6100408.1 DoxX family membrane protein [Corynebacterium flavescens]MDN6430239.1 DoxX family membrane protein [Corynebacterium flavescens]MDN6475961.1 DoxX family membrane protein [Corynebacterium flavescens]
MTKKIDKKLVLDIISAIARFYMAYIWIKAGAAKIGEHMSVTQSIKAYEIFTPEWSNYLAFLIGPLELIGGVLLLLGIFLRQSAVIGTIVLGLFMVGIGQAWARGLGIDCGCFSVDPNENAQVMNYMTTLARDTFYIVLMVWTIKRPFAKFALHP